MLGFQLCFDQMVFAVISTVVALSQGGPVFAHGSHKESVTPRLQLTITFLLIFALQSPTLMPV